MAIYTYVIADDNQVYLSLDKGATWSLRGPAPVIRPSEIYADPNIALKIYVTGSATGAAVNSVHTSVDAGTTFSPIIYPVVSRNFQVQTIDSANVYFAGLPGMAYSFDGGQTASPVVDAGSIYPGATYFTCFHFYFPQFAYAGIGSNTLPSKLFQTVDGGLTWDEITTITFTVNLDETILGITTSVDGSTIVVTTNYGIYNSDNSAISWDYTPFPNKGQSTVFRVSDTEYYVAFYSFGNTSSRFYGTNNNGVSWFSTGFVGTASSIGPGFPADLYMYSSTEAIMSISGGPLLKTVDGGSNWTTTTLDSDVYALTVAEIVCDECPEGYALINNECVQTILYNPLQISGNNVEVLKACGSPSAVVLTCSPIYGQFGLNLMPLINTNNVPYLGYGTTNTDTDYAFTNSLNQLIFPESGYSTPSIFNQPSVITNPLWKTKFTNTAVWGDGVPVGIEFCFTFCFKLNESKTYHIGIASDNYSKFYIDNTLYVNLSGAGTSTSPANIPKVPFTYWHIFPVTLSAGEHTIKMCGIDQGGTNKGIGAEIYSFPESPDSITWFKANCQTMTSTDPYLLFSTQNYIGEFVPDPDDPPTYQCYPGAPILTEICSNGGTCEATITVPYTPCVYQLINCNDSESIIYTTTDVSESIGETIKLLDNTCWIVDSLVDLYTNPISVEISATYSDCGYCNPSYKLINCKDNDVLIYTNTDLSEYVGSAIIKINEYPSDCWQVGPNDKSDVTLEPVTPTGETFATCLECAPILYELNNCNGNGTFIISDSDLTQYVDSTVTLMGITGVCFTLSSLDVDCLGVIMNGNIIQSGQAIFTGAYINGRKQYVFTSIDTDYVYLFSWNATLGRWEIWNSTENYLVAYSTLDIINPVTDYWYRETTPNEEVINGLSVSYCTDVIYNVEVDTEYPNCECCLTQSCN
jgi:hypothetical protein